MLDILLGIPHIRLVFGAVVLLLVMYAILISFILLSTNGHLRRLLREQEKTNALLESMRRPSEPRDTREELPSVRLEPNSRLDNSRKSRT